LRDPATLVLVALPAARPYSLARALSNRRARLQGHV
jgi:hypothetical protein